MATKDLKYAKVYIQDGTPGTPNRITLELGEEGNVEWTIPNPLEYRKNRGRLGAVRAGDEEPMPVTVGGDFENGFSNGSEPVTPYEALRRKGAASSWISTAEDACEPYAVDLILECEPECDDGTLAERITFPDFRVDENGFNMKDGTITIPGKCNALEPIFERYSVST